jgi:hypothetical protein
VSCTYHIISYHILQYIKILCCLFDSPVWRNKSKDLNFLPVVFPRFKLVFQRKHIIKGTEDIAWRHCVIIALDSIILICFMKILTFLDFSCIPYGSQQTSPQHCLWSLQMVFTSLVTPYIKTTTSCRDSSKLANSIDPVTGMGLFVTFPIFCNSNEAEIHSSLISKWVTLRGKERYHDNPGLKFNMLF